MCIVIFIVLYYSIYAKEVNLINMSDLECPLDDVKMDENNYNLLKCYTKKLENNNNNNHYHVKVTVLAVVYTVKRTLFEAMKEKKLSYYEDSFTDSMVTLLVNRLDSDFYEKTYKTLSKFVNVNDEFQNLSNEELWEMKLFKEEAKKCQKFAKMNDLKQWLTSPQFVGMWWTANHCVRCGCKSGPFNFHAKPRERFCNKCAKLGFYGE